MFGLTAMVLAAWLVSHLPDFSAGATALWSAALLAGAAASALAWHRLRPAAVELRWDGRQWLLDAEPRHADLMIQSRLFALLKLRGLAASSAPACWVAVERSEAGANWHGLLVALHARVPAAGSSTEGQAG